MSALDYILYSHLIQGDLGIALENCENWDNIAGLAAAAKASVTGGEQIVIGVRGFAPDENGELVEGGHALWPLRITRDDASETDILVYDCNHPGGVNEDASDTGEVCVLKLFKKNGAYTGWSYHMWSGLDWGSGREGAAIYWSTPLDDRESLFSGGGFSTEYYLYLVQEEVLVESQDFTYRLYPSLKSWTDKVVPVLTENLLYDGNGKVASSADSPDLYWANLGDTVKVTGIDGDGKVGIASANSSVTVQSAAGSELDLTVGDDVRNSASITQPDGSSFSVEYADSDGDSLSKLTVAGSGGSSVSTAQQADGNVSVQGATSLAVTNVDGNTTVADGLDPDATYTVVPSDSEDKPAIVGGTAMHRLYNPNSGEHFCTADENERAYLTEIGWQYEGVGWTAPATSDRPVYRLYNRGAGDHHYTLDANEREYLISIGWEDEDIGWYSAGEGGTPLYRQYNPNATGAGSHNYTADLNERDWLVNNGWNDEDIGWYGV